MIFSILVTGALTGAGGAFASRFLVETPTEQAAVNAVESELDWDGAAYFKAMCEGVANMLPASLDLTPGIPRLATT